MHINDITYKIRGIIFDIHNKLGPGLLEKVYEEILFFELKNAGLFVERQVSIPVYWKDLVMEHGFYADLIVEDKVILELKSVEALAKVHYKQIATYLKLTDLDLGLLINFNEADISKGIKRYIIT